MALVLDLNIVAGSVWQDSAGTIPAAVGDPVGRVDDASGNGYHATQSTSGSKPTLLQDASGHLYLDFDGADDSLEIASAPVTGSAPRTLVIVGVGSASSERPTAISWGVDSAGQRIDWYPNSGNWRLEIGGGGYTSNLMRTEGQRYVAGFTLSGTTLGTAILRQDGVEEAATGTNAINTAAGPLRFGRGTVTGRFFTGALYRARLHDAAMDSVQRNTEWGDLETYYSNPAPGGGGDEIEVSGAGLSVATSASQPAITQDHVLQPAALQVGASMTEPAATVAGSITPESLSVTAATSSPAITQNHAAIPEGLASTPSISGSAVTPENDAYTLALNSLALTLSMGAPTLQQAHSLIAGALALSPSLPGPAITQAHAFSAESLAVAASVSSLFLVLPPDELPPPDRLLVVEAENRYLTVEPENRFITA